MFSEQLIDNLLGTGRLEHFNLSASEHLADSEIKGKIRDFIKLGMIMVVNILVQKALKLRILYFDLNS